MIRWLSAAVLAILLMSCRDGAPAEPPAKTKSELFLLTALPLVWDEQFGLDQAGSPVLETLSKAYRVTAVALPSQVPDGALLLAAQPRALPAEELVALDAWLQRGGRLLLLADPLLEWPSTLPIGDSRRAPVSFADTGLLRHWGLRLDAPEQRGIVKQATGLGEIVFVSPGRLYKIAGNCELEGTESADCAIGAGRVFVVPDADWLDEQRVKTLAGHPVGSMASLDGMLIVVRRPNP